MAILTTKKQTNTGGGSCSPVGSSGASQYKYGGSFGGVAGFLSDGTVIIANNDFYLQGYKVDGVTAENLIGISSGDAVVVGSPTQSMLIALFETFVFDTFAFFDFLPTSICLIICL